MNTAKQKAVEVLNQDTAREVGGWHFYPIGIICMADSQEQANTLSSIVETTITEEATKGRGLFENHTDRDEEDETLDELLGVEAYKCSHSLTGYLSQLQQYNVAGKNGAFLNQDFTRVLFTAIKKCADTIKENTEHPNRVKNKLLDVIKVFDEIPIWGLFFQILILQGLCHIFENLDIDEGKNGFDEAQDLYDWIYKLLADKEIAFCYNPYGDNDLVLLRPFCEYLCTTVVGQAVQKAIQKKGQPQQEAPELPKELSTDGAKAMFERAVKKGLLTVEAGQYKWAGNASLYGYFIEQVTKAYEMRPENKRIPWGKFGFIVNHKNLLSTAKAAVQNYKNKELPPPQGDDIVNQIIKG